VPLTLLAHNENCDRCKRTTDVIKKTLEELFNTQVVTEFTCTCGTLKFIAGSVLTHINPIQSLVQGLLYCYLSSKCRAMLWLNIQITSNFKLLSVYCKHSLSEALSFRTRLCLQNLTCTLSFTFIA